jgi:alkylated DNA repair protein (DNA oxidative demethylase)
VGICRHQVAFIRILDGARSFAEPVNVAGLDPGRAMLCKVADMRQGFQFFPGHMSSAEQRSLTDLLMAAIAEAPLFTPMMPKSGRPFSVRMTNLGSLGWVSDRRGYRYQASHPETGLPWPAIPDGLLALWRSLPGCGLDPEACLVNVYRDNARMGLHQDRDELDFAAPVVSISLGDTALFRLGGVERGGMTETMRLNSGDVLVMGGESRLCFHGIDRICGGTSSLVPGGGRINLTLRRVNRP